MKKETRLKHKKDYGARLLVVGLLVLLEVALIISFFVLLIYSQLDGVAYITSTIVLYLLNIILSLFIISTKAQVDFKISWLIVVNLVPIAGPLFYFIFANKITTRSKKKNRFLKIDSHKKSYYKECSAELDLVKEADYNYYRIFNYINKESKYSLYTNTLLSYYKVGEEGFPNMLEELKKAKKFIFIEFFIVESGEMFNPIFDILAQKVKEGVDVRFIYDDFGSVRTVGSNFYKLLRNVGIKSFAFNRIRPSADIRQNSRDHRKILVIDGVCGFTGGINLADEYINKKVRFGHWKDNVVMLKGEGVEGLTRIFLSNWTLASNAPKEDILPFLYRSNIEYLCEYCQNKSFVLPFGDVPFDNHDIGRNAYLMMIQKAKDSITISTPYLIPDTELLTALKIASASGVRVKIITPGIPDKKIIYQCTRSYYAELLAAGIEIYEYTPGFNHTKLMVIDDELAITGTINFDFRAFYLNFENAILVYNDPIIKKMSADLEGMIEKSTKQIKEKYLNAPIYKRIYRSILKVLAPLF